MDRRYFLSKGGVLLAASTPLVWADDDKKKRPKPKPTPTPTPTPTPSPTTKSRVIVIGGGMAGATVAKYLRLWGNGIAVTLVERNSSYVSNIFSSLVLTGQRSMASLTYNYSKLLSAYGVQVVQGDVVEVDPIGVKVKLADGTVLTADRIVMAPGIEFDTVPGLGTSNLMPHAWQAGAQTSLLASQLASMTDGAPVVLTIPKMPYRCPPGPYERACLVADWMKTKKPKSKLFVLDANPRIVTEEANFTNGFALNRITYVPNAEITSVDPASMTVHTTMGPFEKNGVVNLIPGQRAGGLIRAAGLNNATKLTGDTAFRFAGVNQLSYASTVSGADKIHIIGDSSATAQPKAGHIANQEAKVCADAIVRAFAGLQPDQAPVTSSACYSTITMSQASWLTAVFQYDPGTAAMVANAAGSGASAGWSAGNFKEMNTWFNALMADSFA
jgi:sulfide dehydrogenase [flavocytochrome c] flavoprotein subunit